MASSVLFASSWVVGFLVIAIIGLVLFVTRRSRRPGEPPLDKGLIPWLGHAIEFRRDMYAFLRRMQHKHGDTFTVCLAGRYFTFILDPHEMTAVGREPRSMLDFMKYAYELISDVFSVNYKAEYRKPTGAMNIRHLQGEGLVGLTDAMVHQLHLLMGPGSFDEGNRHMGNGGHRDTKWHESSLFDFCYNIVFRAGYLTLFGQDLGGSAVQNTRSLEVFKEFRKYDQLFPTIASSTLWPAKRKEADRLKSWFWEHLTVSLLRVREHVSPWILGRDEKLAELQADKETRDRTLFMLLWASQGNAGPASFWTLAYLMKHADAMAAVRAEVQQLLEATGQSEGAETREISLTRDALVNTPVLDSVIEEMLRLRSAPTLMRAVQQDMTLQVPGASGPGTKLRAGDRLAMFPHLSPHMDPEVHADPKEFKFDRFLNKDGSKKTDFFKSGHKLRYPTMPWGTGVSICPGRFFAINEIKQFTVLMLIHYDIDFCDPTTKVPDINASRFGFGIMQPTHDIRFRYRSRF
uniref:7-alpha-hydroxycholest-4-en-3-one 12-alpha-hydroxylase-like n=2 Tax=Petromyzon marinus TaxID=7757 RepID=A0AAJ7TGP3_PETMA|nr:7-alpha-hydroxycholest-4-en-3-one 12-alpha-hydroxylase-like [Petromyzon marinus]XP_032817525.1 7-alpha-hydroxycholest-4-en-3-one 12-alpha-hydroxylase-like [Petromyzon marinus]